MQRPENSEYLTAMNEMNRQMAFLNVTKLGGKIGDLEEEAMNIRTKMWQMERERAPEAHVMILCMSPLNSLINLFS